MKITAQEEYGLRCMLQLAAHPVGEPLAVSEIARREGLSVAYAEKLLRILSRAGLVRSRRGANGGYELIRSSEEISLGDVARALGGALTSKEICNRHTGQMDVCVHSGNCGIQPVWQGITDYVFNIMDGINLSQLLGGDSLTRQLFVVQLPVPNEKKKIYTDI